MTGVEPAAIQTATAYAYNDEAAARFPLVTDEPYGNAPAANSASTVCQSGAEPFDITKYWGNLSPWYSVPSSAYGLPDASPAAPSGCSITQVHLLYRHGARYPTDGAAPATFAGKIANATKTGFGAEGDLAFFNEWTYKLGAELLTPFGRLQNFELGVAFRQQYGYLLNNFTQQGTIPVFRTESQDRMVKTAQNFAAGLFGVPNFLDEVNIEIMVEAKVRILRPMRVTRDVKWFAMRRRINGNASFRLTDRASTTLVQATRPAPTPTSSPRATSAAPSPLHTP